MPMRGSGPSPPKRSARAGALVLGFAMAALPAWAGDAARGRAIVASRQSGLCLLCHAGPFAEEHLQGTIGPDLRGVGSRLSVEELRRRLVDPAASNPDTVMPSYAASEGLRRVAPGFAGRPILTPAQIDDVVAFLATLRDE